jgi:hypothetical protein
MSAAQCRVYHGLLRYAVHLAGWVVSTGLAAYGSVVWAAPHPCTYARERPRYWRHEAKAGLRACEAFLRQDPTHP